MASRDLKNVARFTKADAVMADLSFRSPPPEQKILLRWTKSENLMELGSAAVEEMHFVLTADTDRECTGKSGREEMPSAMIRRDK
jgi:hypothetical protein